MNEIRTNWEIEEVKKIYFSPIIENIFKAAQVHASHNVFGEVQISKLISIKTGGCKEDCGYCPQSAKFKTNIQIHPLLKLNEVLSDAEQAKKNGASRICMGASWREVKDNRDFEKVLEMVAGVNDLGLEVCCTLGMLTYEQAQKLQQAGCFAYNHNIDTSKEYYSNIITTRKFEDRLETLENARKAKLTVCCGGIIGMGESDADRVSMLHTLATMDVHPESVPINALVPVEGTAVEMNKPIHISEMLRMIATARILMPKSSIRLSAGRSEMSMSDQILCFIAGANSIFAGDKLLTTPNNDKIQDDLMFDLFGLTKRGNFQNHGC